MIITKDIYYDRSLKLWVRILRDQFGEAILDAEGFEATYFSTKSEAVA